MKYSIAVIEFYPIVLSLCLWGHRMRNQCVLFFTENESLVSVINKQTSKYSDLMTFVRTMVLVCLQNNILFKAKRIAGSRNVLADSLSQFQVHTSFSNAHSLSPTAWKLANIVSDLAQSSLQPSSIPTYKQAWTLFTQFHIKIVNNGLVALPISPSVIALFIAYLFDLKYAPSTVNTYVSAIGYSRRLSGFPDPTRVFYIVQILKGYGKTGFRLDSRLPITLSILNRIIEASSHIAGAQYQICQFKAMCSLAFFAFLRIGELTMITSNNQPLQMHQLSHIYDTNNQITGIKLTFENFKHNYNQRPFSLEIYRQSMICPVQLLRIIWFCVGVGLVLFLKQESPQDPT